MNRSIEKTVSPKDMFLWLIIAAIIVGAVSVNYYFSAYPSAIRLIGWLVVIILSFFLVLLTQKGQKLKVFAKDAHIELLKVVWPTKQETVRTTMVVFVMVVLVGFFLWLADAMFVWIIGKITV